MLQNLNTLSNHFSKFVCFKMAYFVENNALIGCKQTVRPYVALLSQITVLEVFILQRDCVAVSHSLTRDLTKQQILS